MGDLYSRIGEKSDIENTQLNPFVNMSVDEVKYIDLPRRTSHGGITNRFRDRLFTACKDCSVCVLNCRLEPGLFTSYS